MCSAHSTPACRDVWLWLRKLVVITGLLWAALFGALQWVQPTSRRACNMPYVMLSLALNWMMLVLFITGCLLSNSCQPVFLLEACSRNMLWLFLLANVMTGAINMTINSLLVSTGHAIGVVCAYMFTICCVACAMHSNNLRFDMTYMSFKSTVKEGA